jgi:hypothetical protein
MSAGSQGTGPVIPPPFGKPPGVSPGSILRAVSGPLLLITLGILLAMDHMGKVSFGRTWPALLIVFGACRLFERLGPRSV